MADISNRILYEDNHLLVVNKLPSEIVQGDKTGDLSLLDDVKNHLKVTYNKQGNVFAGLVHRIDRPVSGAVVFAKTSKALSRMTALVRERDFDKKYFAIVRNKPPEEEGFLEHFLIKNEAQNKSYISKEGVSGAKNAQLKYKIAGASDSFFLLEITLLTGRHHQIRVQLSAIGCPIVGDLKYGDKRSNPDASICLHAHSITFEHPIQKKNVTIIADPPRSMPWKVFFIDK